MSIINDALKKTQQAFKPKKKEKVQDKPKPKDDANVNVYEKMYKERDKKNELSAAVAQSGKRSSKNKVERIPRKTREWVCIHRGHRDTVPLQVSKSGESV